MGKKIAFYITNHGYGHAARNVAVIEKLLLEYSDVEIWVKSDKERIGFLKRNLQRYDDRIIYNEGYSDVGLLFYENTLEINKPLLLEKIRRELSKWPVFIEKEKKFLKEKNVEIVVSDIIPWVLLAAKGAGKKSVLLCNFTWYEMYKDFLPKQMSFQYYNAYNSAYKIFLYEFGNRKIKKYYKNVESLSLVSRDVHPESVQNITTQYRHPIVFVSVGKSVEISECYDVSKVHATFITTVGVNLIGDNVVKLSPEEINTQDYIKASDYVISKTGWSTLAEVFLNRKKATFIPRGKNEEDEEVVCQIKENNCGLIYEWSDLKNIDKIIEALEHFTPDNLQMFYDSSFQIAKYIYEL